MSKDLNGIWYNQHGSMLELDISDAGRLVGTFETGVGLSERGERFPVTGFTCGDLVAFTVTFRDRHSLTSWVGHAFGSGDEQRMETLWHMAVEFPPNHKPDEKWKGTWAGSDVFVRERHPRLLKLRRQPSHPAVR
jgi:hypothetical protein